MVRIREPQHGAVLHHRHGEQTAEGLCIRVRGTAPLGAAVEVNGVLATRVGDRFEAAAMLRDAEQEIAAVAAGPTGRCEHCIRVVWDRESRPRYRFAIDDNSFFPRDIVQAGCKSLFDCFYLQLLRELNRDYGTKFVLNLFHATPDGDFDLRMFPDRYRTEWADNAHWLKLAFHAQAEFPDRPYERASAAELLQDYDRVATEILRFAGESVLSPATLVHWGMVQPEVWPALAKRGVTVLSGFFTPEQGGNYTTDGETLDCSCSGRFDINYGMDPARSEYLSRNDALKDFPSGMLFSRVDIVCNNTPVDQVVPVLAPLARDPNTAEIMDLLTHEQYFWPFYAQHRPDHADRCRAAIRFCAENGYEPVFLHEGFLGI